VDRPGQTNGHLGQVAPTNLYRCTPAEVPDFWLSHSLLLCARDLPAF